MEEGGRGTLSEARQSLKKLLLRYCDGLEQLERLENSTSTSIATVSLNSELSFTIKKVINQIQSLCVEMDRRFVAAKPHDLYKSAGSGGGVRVAIFSSNFEAKVVNTPRGPVESPKDVFEVFYLDYGNQEEVPYSQLRPLDPSVSVAPGLAQLCSLAYVKIPNLEEDFGQEAAQYLSELALSSGKEFRAMVEERDTTGGKVKGQGTGPVIVVTLVAVDAEISVNAAMLQEGLARMEKRNRWDRSARKQALDNLEMFHRCHNKVGICELPFHPISSETIGGVGGT